MPAKTTSSSSVKNSRWLSRARTSATWGAIGTERTLPDFGETGQRRLKRGWNAFQFELRIACHANGGHWIAGCYEPDGGAGKAMCHILLAFARRPASVGFKRIIAHDVSPFGNFLIEPTRSICSNFTPAFLFLCFLSAAASGGSAMPLSNRTLLLLFEKGLLRIYALSISKKRISLDSA